VYINGGRTSTGLEVVHWAREAERLGAGEILLTSMDTDGTRAGYDVTMLAAVSRAVSIPVIASGGAGAVEHFYDALTEGGADAALAASLFHYRQVSVREVKAHLAGRRVNVRP
jgi:cyclase